jgi:S-DNA-T family DNA segregation ATPase FtsK/SpoIIIE
MAKAGTRSRTAARPKNAAVHRNVSKPSPRRRMIGRAQRGPSPFTTLRSLLFRWETIGVMLVVLAVVSIPWLVPIASGLQATRDALVEAIGVGTFALIILLGFFGWLILRHVLLQNFYFYWRRWLTSAFAAGFLLGFFGLFRPHWRLGGTTLSKVTAGGHWGHALVASPLGILLWLSLGLAAIVVAWPRQSLTFARRSPGTVWRWRIPQRTWHGMQRMSQTVFPTRIEPEPPAPVSMETLMWARTTTAPTPEAPGGAAEVIPLHLQPDAAQESPPEEPPQVVEPWQPELPIAVAGPDGRIIAPARQPNGRWEMPPIETLLPAGPEAGDKPDNSARARLIVDTLASFGVDAEVVQVNEGPTVTQFGVEPGWEVKTRTTQERDSDGRPLFDRNGHPKVKTEEVSRTRVRVSQITSLANDLALALATPSLRIEAPVPGKPVVGIEVPNVTTSLVTLRSVIESTAFQRMANRSKLALALGKSVAGEPVVADLTKMPHLLIAGATGSGKSVCINSVIACLLMQASPDDVRFVMIDPKRVELAAFAPIPHLAFSSIVIDIDKVVGTLQAVIHEMESRYRKFASLAVRNIEAYNRHPKAHQKLPYWVVIIDELADLMMAAPYEVERQVCRLAQLARATGIHLIIATQRPSVDVVTGLIKANFPTRIAFAVSSQVDSRTILDGGGAEKLLGRGDMLYQPTDAAKPKRLQGTYVSDAEIERLVAFWTQERFKEVQRAVFDDLLDESKAEVDEMFGADDPLYERARALALEHTRMSTSMLQRRLRIGYPRAARLMDMLEEKGVVGASEGGSSRQVLAHGDEEEGDEEGED